jgi:hypothetical protein
MTPQEVFVKTALNSGYSLQRWDAESKKWVHERPLQPLPKMYVLTREELEALLREAILKAWDKTEDTQNIGDLVSQLLTPKP